MHHRLCKRIVHVANDRETLLTSTIELTTSWKAGCMVHMCQAAGHATQNIQMKHLRQAHLATTGCDVVVSVIRRAPSSFSSLVMEQDRLLDFFDFFDFFVIATGLGT
jgi:hypothetical protein